MPAAHPAGTLAPRFLLFLAAGCLCAPLSRGQAGIADEGTLRGNRAEVAVTLRERGGQVVTALAAVKVYQRGTLVGQTATAKGRANFILNSLGEYSITVDAAGYKPAQKDISLTVAVKAEEEIYLVREPAPNETMDVSGKPLLAPKAKEAFDKSLQALSENKLEEAEKDVGQAAKLAPNHPDVLYIQGVIYLRRGDWGKAQKALETAAQIDPNNPRVLGALGMAYVDQGKYEQAVAPLEHSLEIDAGSWETHWTLAKAYYHRERYPDALKESAEALAGSRGAAPEIELLVAQSQTAVGQYEECARTLRAYLKNHPQDPGTATARRWLEKLAADGKIKPD